MSCIFRVKSVGLKVSGVTLIELLIVFSIVGLLVALVAPVGYRQMEKARAQEEWLSLKREIDALAFRAFSNGNAVEIQISGSVLRWNTFGDNAQTRRYEHLFFDPEQRVVISPKGVASASSVQVWQSGRERELPLNNWMVSQ